LVLILFCPSSGEFKVFFSVKSWKSEIPASNFGTTYYLISVHMELYHLVQKKGKMDTSSNNSSEGGAMETTARTAQLRFVWIKFQVQ
jgi:hypothetical protein